MQMNCHDIAAYILRQHGEMTAMTLQKLVYYAQAWTLVWEERPLFLEPIEARACGPVIPSLYERHRGAFLVDASLYSEDVAGNLDSVTRENIDRVLAFYGDKTAQWLIQLSKAERPWRDANGPTPIGADAGTLIPIAAIAEYYLGLLEA